MTNVINQEVSVNAFYFFGHQMKTFPREIEYGGQAVTFAGGLRYLVQKGNEATKLFDMSTLDGLTYRLQQRGDSWTLLKTSRPDLSLGLADDRQAKTALSATEAYLDMSKASKAILAGEGSQGTNWGAMSLSTKGAL